MLNDTQTPAYKLAETMAKMYQDKIHIDDIERYFKANSTDYPFWGKLAIVETFHWLKETRH